MNAVLDDLGRTLAALAPPAPRAEGRVEQYDGLVAETSGFPVSPGAVCEIDVEGDSPARAAVMRFARGANHLLLEEPGAAIRPGAPVRVVSQGVEAAVGDALLGRVVDADGRPLDGGAPVETAGLWPMKGRPRNPLGQHPVDRPLDVGVRAINAALTVGRGQRLGIIAGSGVGKSVLIEMMAHNTDADVIVVGLIGERAREVGAFTRAIMGNGTAGRCAVVATPADRSPLQRLRAADRASAIAESFRARGRHVLLILDSLTRVAHARREVGLALGEPPTSKGYPASALSAIPTLIERAGPGGPGEGSVTAFFTILADGDDPDDPVVDTARAILDGHLVLSRSLAQMGHFPAIDLPASVSRVMNDLVGDAHRAAAQRLRRRVAVYMENRDLLLMGGHTPGQDPELDAAVRLWPEIRAFLTQDMTQPARFAESVAALDRLMAEETG